MNEKIIRMEIGSFTQQEIDPKDVQNAINELAKKHKLDLQDLKFEVGRPFPVDGAILIVLTLASTIAYDIWKEFILPELREKYILREDE